MRLVINAAFAFTLVAFATGRPIHDARLDQMRLEFASLNPAVAPFTRAGH